MSVPSVLDRLIPMKQVCQQAGVGRTTIDRLLAKGDFPKPTYVGTSRLWSEQSVQLWIKAQLDKRQAS